MTCFIERVHGEGGLNVIVLNAEAYRVGKKRGLEEVCEWKDCVGGMFEKYGMIWKYENFWYVLVMRGVYKKNEEDGVDGVDEVGVGDGVLEKS